MKKIKNVLVVMFVFVIAAVSLSACGKEEDKGSIEQDRIIIDGVEHTFYSDTIDSIKAKDGNHFDKVFQEEKSLHIYNCDTDGDVEGSVLFHFDEAGQLKELFLEEPADVENRIDFCLEGIDNEASFFDVLELLQLTENGVYTPYETYFKVDGYVTMTHQIGSMMCEVVWFQNDGYISMLDKEHGYDVTIFSYADTIYDKNSFSSILMQYSNDK